MKVSISILIVLIFLSCKKTDNEVIKNKSKENLKSLPVEKKLLTDNIVKVNIDVKILQNDKFRLYYIDRDDVEKFTEKKVKVVKVQGSTNYQKVSFNLPENIFPYKLRIDVGENSLKNETPISIDKIEIILNNNKIEITSENLTKYFRSNVYLTKNDKDFYRKVVDAKYDPFFVSTALLNKKIEIEL